MDKTVYIFLRLAIIAGIVWEWFGAVTYCSYFSVSIINPFVISFEESLLNL